MLNWIKSLFAPQTQPPMPSGRKPIKAHYRKYKSGKKVWVEPKQKH